MSKKDQLLADFCKNLLDEYIKLGRNTVQNLGFKVEIYNKLVDLHDGTYNFLTNENNKQYLGEILQNLTNINLEFEKIKFTNTATANKKEKIADLVFSAKALINKLELENVQKIIDNLDDEKKLIILKTKIKDDKFSIKLFLIRILKAFGYFVLFIILCSMIATIFSDDNTQNNNINQTATQKTINN